MTNGETNENKQNRTENREEGARKQKHGSKGNVVKSLNLTVTETHCWMWTHKPVQKNIFWSPT